MYTKYKNAINLKKFYHINTIYSKKIKNKFYVKKSI